MKIFYLFLFAFATACSYGSAEATSEGPSSEESGTRNLIIDLVYEQMIEEQNRLMAAEIYKNSGPIEFFYEPRDVLAFGQSQSQYCTDLYRAYLIMALVFNLGSEDTLTINEFRRDLGLRARKLAPGVLRDSGEQSVCGSTSTNAIVHMTYHWIREGLDRDPMISKSDSLYLKTREYRELEERYLAPRALWR